MSWNISIHLPLNLPTFTRFLYIEQSQNVIRRGVLLRLFHSQIGRDFSITSLCPAKKKENLFCFFAKSRCHSASSVTKRLGFLEGPNTVLYLPFFKIESTSSSYWLLSIFFSQRYAFYIYNCIFCQTFHIVLKLLLYETCW